MGLARTIKQWRSSLVRRHELEVLGREQREALARDVGLPGHVLASLAARGAGAGAELPRLMEALSLDADRIRRAHGALVRDMSVICSGCSETARCRWELSNGRAPSVYSEYCPNAETLRELQGERRAKGGLT